MPEGKIDVYNLGDMGVSRVKSPVHLQDGEFYQAQNAMATRSRGRHSIRKRFGMRKLNSTTASGQIYGIAQVSATDPTPSDSD